MARVLAKLLDRHLRRVVVVLNRDARFVRAVGVIEVRRGIVLKRVGLACWKEQLIDAAESGAQRALVEADHPVGDVASQKGATTRRDPCQVNLVFERADSDRDVSAILADLPRVPIRIGVAETVFISRSEIAARSRASPGTRCGRGQAHPRYRRPVIFQARRTDRVGASGKIPRPLIDIRQFKVRYIRDSGDLIPAMVVLRAPVVASRDPIHGMDRPATANGNSRLVGDD